MTKSSSAGSLLAAFQRMPNLLVFVVIFQFLEGFRWDFLSNTVRSVVHCPLPKPNSKGLCPKGCSSSSNDVCTPIERGETGWSLSVHCADLDYVMSEDLRVASVGTQVFNASSIIAAIFMAPFTDRVGRKPTALLSLTLLGVFGVLMAMSCLVASWNLIFGLILFARCLGGFALCGFPAVQSMIADRSGASEMTDTPSKTEITKTLTGMRGDGMAALNVAQQIGWFFLLIVCTMVLRLDLADYVFVWASYVILIVVFVPVYFGILTETLPAKISDQVAKSSCQVIVQGIQSYRLVLQDPFLRWFIPISATALTFFAEGLMSALSSWLIAHLGFSQVKSSLPGTLVNPVCIIIGAGLASPMIRRWGAIPVYQFGMILMSTPMCILGLCSINVPRDLIEKILWPVYAIGVVGFGLWSIAYITTMSVRLPAQAQAAANTCSLLIVNISGLFVAPLFTQTLFRPAEKGWELGRIWFALSLAGFAASVLIGILSCIVPLHPRLSHGSDEESGKNEISQIENS